VTWRRRFLLLVALPVLVATSDPAGDVTACLPGGPQPSDGLDLAGADGFLTEGGQAVEFRVRFHGDVVAPDPQEPAFRVDIILRDPRLQTFSVGPYREVNRIIRFDATDPPEVGVLLLPEAGFSSPSTYFFEDGMLRVTLAARQLGIEAENLEHIDLRPVRWNVVAREGNACDSLTEGRPVLRLLEGTPSPTSSPPVTPSPPGAATPPDEGGGGGSLGARVGIAFVVLLGGGAIAVAVVVAGRRRAAGTGSKPGSGQSSGL